MTYFKFNKKDKKLGTKLSRFKKEYHKSDPYSTSHLSLHNFVWEIHDCEPIILLNQTFLLNQVFWFTKLVWMIC